MTHKEMQAFRQPQSKSTVYKYAPPAPREGTYLPHYPRFSRVASPRNSDMKTKIVRNTIDGRTHLSNTRLWIPVGLRYTLLTRAV